MSEAFPPADNVTTTVLSQLNDTGENLQAKISELSSLDSSYADENKNENSHS